MSCFLDNKLPLTIITFKDIDLVLALCKAAHIYILDVAMVQLLEANSLSLCCLFQRFFAALRSAPACVPKLDR